MDAEIIEAIPFQIDIDDLAKTLRIKEGSDLVQKLKPMVQEAQAIGRPRAFYKVSFIEFRGDNQVVIDGVAFTSRILQVNLKKVFRIFPFVATCGVELEDWSKTIQDILQNYWADVIKEMALRSAVNKLKDSLIVRYHPGTLSVMNPGSLPDWPLTEQRPLFSILGQGPESIGVRLTDHCLMVPIKSFSGIWFPGEETFESCQLCSREKCPGRRTAYDPELYDRRYAKK